jgi:hypothetical protein
MCVILTVPIVLLIAFLFLGLPALVLGGWVGSQVAGNDRGVVGGVIAAGVIGLLAWFLAADSNWGPGQFVLASGVAGVLGGIIGGSIEKGMGGG